MKVEKCKQCGKKKMEYEMLYVVVEDAYFCSQKCWDKYGVTKNGEEKKNQA